jgi:hypothetical protein
MAVTTKSAMKIYDPRTRSAYRERVGQIVDLFNSGSQNTIRLVAAARGGDFDYNSIWGQPAAGLINRRDPNSLAAVTDQALSQLEKVAVKVNRRFGPVATTFDALRKIEEQIGPDDDPADVIMTVLGTGAADRVTQEKLNVGISALAAAVRNDAGSVSDVSALSGSAALVTADTLNTALFKRGDRSGDIRAWVMHSSKLAQLTGGQITGGVTGVASIVMNGASPLSLGRPIIVTDCPALVLPSSKFLTLGLVENALMLEDTEGEMFFGDVVTGAENVYLRAQGEYAYNLSIEGYSWDVANGGENPSNAALATGTNWDTYLTEVTKNGPGVALVSL